LSLGLGALTTFDDVSGHVVLLTKMQPLNTIAPIWKIIGTHWKTLACSWKTIGHTIERHFKTMANMWKA